MDDIENPDTYGREEEIEEKPAEIQGIVASDLNIEKRKKGSFRRNAEAFNMHKKVKELTGRNRRQQPMILTMKDANNKILLGAQAKFKKWK